MANQHQIEQSLQPYLKAVEHKRLKLRGKLLLTGFLCLLIPILSTGLFYFLFSFLAEVAGVALVNLFVGLCTTVPAVLVALVAWQQVHIQNAKVCKAYKELLQTEAFLPIFKEWNATLNYFPEQTITKEEVTSSQIIQQHDLVRGDGYYEGKVADGRTFRFAEIDLLEEKTRWNNNGYPEIFYVSLFKGLFFVLEDSLPYPNFSGQLRLVTKPLLVTSRQAVRPKRGPVDDILDADFEVQDAKEPSSIDRQFTITSTTKKAVDQLPPDTQQRLLYLREALKEQLILTFDQDHCYGTVAHKEAFWDSPLSRSLLHSPTQKRLAWNFAHCFMIVEELAALTTPEQP